MEFLARILDLAWFTVAAVAVILLWVCEIHQHHKGGRLRRALVVLLALIVLLPSLSTRDDLIGLAFLLPHANQHSQPALESQTGSDFQLEIHLLALDHFLVTSLHTPPLNFHFAARVPKATSLFREHTPLRQACRAPPMI
jgi:hypothetical protein